MKNIIGLLIVASMFLVMTAAYSFAMCKYLHHFHSDLQSGANYQKYQVFVQNVLDGKLQGRPDQYVSALRVQQDVIKAESGVSDSVIDSLKDLGWIAVFGIVTQVAAIYYIRRKLQKA